MSDAQNRCAFFTPGSVFAMRMKADSCDDGDVDFPGESA
jgi:hypothetical protein